MATARNLGLLMEYAGAKHWPADRTLLLALDVCDPQAWDKALQETISRFGRVDVLMNVAGSIRPSAVQDLPPEHVHEQIDVNVKGVIFGTQAAARIMIRQGGGHIINISSLCGLAPIPGVAVYSASKYAVRGFSLAAAQELRPRGVYVTVVCPDAVETRMLEEQVDHDASAVIFSNPRPLTLEKVTRVILGRVLRRRPLEAYIPAIRGRFARLMDLHPLTTRLAMPILRKRGLAHLRALRSRLLATLFVACGLLWAGSLFGAEVPSGGCTPGPPNLTAIPCIPGLGDVAPVRCLKWDYFEHPVETKGSGDGGAVFGTAPAFDGFPASVTHPTIRVFWNCDAPTAQVSAYVIIDYKCPVAVTRYVHYFDRVDTWKAWKDVEIHASDNGAEWTLRQTFANLGRDYPQVLGIDRPTSARYYKIVVKSLTDKVPKLHTYEIETYCGATIGNVSPGRPVAIQSEPHRLAVRVVNPDAAMNGAVLRIIAPKDSLNDPQECRLPSVPKGSDACADVVVTPLHSGVIPILVELHVGKFLIDRRPYTIRVKPKLVLSAVTPVGSTPAQAGQGVKVRGRITNEGTTAAVGVRAAWMGGSAGVGDLAPGQSAAFSIEATAPPGYSEGALEASAAGLTRTLIRRAVICPTVTSFAVRTKSLTTQWNSNGIEAKMDTQLAGGGTFSGWLMVFSGQGTPIQLKSVGQEGKEPVLVGDLGGAMLRIMLGVRRDGGEDPEFRFQVIPDDPHPTAETVSTKFSVRFSVADPKVMFRPHQDLFTKEHGPNHGYGNHTHYAPTRMLTVQTASGTVSMVPDTDNMNWGFVQDFSLNAFLDIDLADADPLGQGIWQPIWKGPKQFTITLPMRKGDWWDAYRYVVKDIFKFEQARQWAMPLTQMQMLSVRQMERQENWSTIFNTMRSYPNVDFHYNFYGTTYTLPAFYSYYLATDDETARIKAEAVKNWLITYQEQAGPLQGAWFSQYLVKGNPPSFSLEGTDQAGNRWLLPHSTGSSVKTLLWYWYASGKKDEKAFAAARKGCDFLVARQRPDGGWPYAFDLQGKAVSEQADAGQIWCAWALWKMHESSGEPKYRAAALKSKDFFVKTFLNNHLYQGYWEDVSGGGGNVTRSSETYEAAIACQAFAEMGDPKLALEVAKDSAVSLWTRVTSTRQYETAYGQTIEQGSGGPSQAQSPMVGVAMQRMYELSGDRFWNDLSGAVKAIHFCADPDQAYGMVAIAGWDECLTGTICPPIDNVKVISRPGGLGRGVWNEWQTAQYAWLALDWLIREGNMRAPHYVKIDPVTMRGTVLGEPGRVKMPEERCDVTGIDHFDVNWAGYRNDRAYVLMLMNHQEKTTVAVRPHEAHLDCYTRPPHILVSDGKECGEVAVIKKGVQYFVEIPAKATAILIWDRIR